MPLSMGLERVRWLSYKHKEWKREPSKWKSGQTEFGLVNSSEVSVLVILSIVFLSEYFRSRAMSKVLPWLGG